LRHAAIDRKMTQGTRGANGRRWCERIWTALAVCRQQSRSPFHSLQTTFAAYLAKRKTPSLLAGNA
jgi:hypothetical protein